MPKRVFYIECKLKLQYLTILWKSRWVGGGGLWTWIPGGIGGGTQVVLEIQVEWGVKKHAFCRGMDFFWNNPMRVIYDSNKTDKLNWPSK